jgi:hypothetical protein
MIRRVAAISVVLAATGLGGCGQWRASKPLNAKAPTYYWTAPQDSTASKKTASGTAPKSGGFGWQGPRETAGR